MIGKRFFAALTLLFVAAAANLHAARCSNASLKGTYAYSSQGFTEVTSDVSPAGFAPWAQTGLVVYDGEGNITSGTFTIATITAAGGVDRGTFTGSYTVKTDCTGTAQSELEDGTTFHFDLVVLGPARHTIINTDPGAFINVYSVQRIAGEVGEGETK